MGFLSHRVKSSDLEAGDHIYTWRTAFSYSHHGIYIGGDKVVHFTQHQNLSSSNNSTFTCFSSSVSNVSPTCLYFPGCGFRKGESGVTMSCLNCFMGNGSLYRFEYGVTKCVFIAKFRGGVCTTAKSDPPEAVIHRAMYLLCHGFGNYNLVTNNCEDFALYCKTGLLGSSPGQNGPGISGQAVSVVGVPVAAVISFPLKLFFPSPVGWGAATAVTYTFNKYASDIGVRSDTFKVKVEELERSGNAIDDNHYSVDDAYSSFSALCGFLFSHFIKSWK